MSGGEGGQPSRKKARPTSADDVVVEREQQEAVEAAAPAKGQKGQRTAGYTLTLKEVNGMHNTVVSTF